MSTILATGMAVPGYALAVDANGALTYDITMADLRSRVNAQVGASATSTSD